MDRTEIEWFARIRSLLTNHKGLSLVEVLVATVVLAIGLLGIAMMQYMAVAGSAFGREMQIASELGQERLEIIKSTDYASVVSDSELLSDPDKSRFGGVTFTRRWWVRNDCRDITVEYKPADPCDPAAKVGCASAQNNAKALAVRVCWSDKNGGNHSITVPGFKCDEDAAP